MNRRNDSGTIGSSSRSRISGSSSRQQLYAPREAATGAASTMATAALISHEARIVIALLGVLMLLREVVVAATVRAPFGGGSSRSGGGSSRSGGRR